MARTARRPRSKLRARHDEATRELILDGLVALLSERGGFELTYFEIARRAGVSVRTLYRHFPRRDDLFDALTRRVNEVVRVDYGRDRQGIVGAIRAVFATYDRHAPLIAAQLQAGLGRVRARGRVKRVGLMSEILAAELSDLSAERRAAAAGLFTCLFSASIWKRLRDEVGLDGEASGEVVAWAVDTLWRSLQVENERARRRTKN